MIPRGCAKASGPSYYSQNRLVISGISHVISKNTLKIHRKRVDINNTRQTWSTHMNKVYEIVTERIIEAIEQEQCLPWRKSWRTLGTPRNAATGKHYNGINRVILSIAGESLYATYKQWATLGAQVRRGEKGLPVVFWSVLEKEDKNGKTQRQACVRYSTVFAASQVDNYTPIAVELSKHSPLEQCELLVAKYATGPNIHHHCGNAYYVPSQDAVYMPHLAQFDSPEAYYSTLFHELAHSTGHSQRLARFQVTDTRADLEQYGKEELVAELAASFLCADCHIANRTLDNSTSYLQHWLKAIKSDCRLLPSAASAAQKACDLIHNRVVRDITCADEEKKLEAH